MFTRNPQLSGVRGLCFEWWEKNWWFDEAKITSLNTITEICFPEHYVSKEKPWLSLCCGGGIMFTWLEGISQ